MKSISIYFQFHEHLKKVQFSSILCKFFKNIAGSSNGRTTVSGTVYLGSSPSPAARSLSE